MLLCRLKHRESGCLRAEEEPSRPTNLQFLRHKDIDLRLKLVDCGGKTHLIAPAFTRTRLTWTPCRATRQFWAFLHLFPFLFDFPAFRIAIAIACFCGRPARTSVRMLEEITFRDEPDLRGIIDSYFTNPSFRSTSPNPATAARQWGKGGRPAAATEVRFSAAQRTRNSSKETLATGGIPAGGNGFALIAPSGFDKVAISLPRPSEPSVELGKPASARTVP